MLTPGARVPQAAVWLEPGAPPLQLTEVLVGELTLLCFYPYDWSPTCTNELLLLHERRGELAAAGVRPVAISRDSPWSHRAFRESLGVDVLLLSDANGEAARGFGVAADRAGVRDIAERAAFLVDGGATVRASWLLHNEIPDVDAAIAAASSLSA
jgi:peroxiredoxin